MQIKRCVHKILKVIQMYFLLFWIFNVLRIVERHDNSLKYTYKNS